MNETAINCPKCVGKCGAIELGGKENTIVNQCFICEGLWFDRDELDKVLSREFMDNLVKK